LSSILLFGTFGRSVSRNVHDAAGELETGVKLDALKHLNPDGTFD